MRGLRRADVGVGRHARALRGLRAEPGHGGVPDRHRPVQDGSGSDYRAAYLVDYIDEGGMVERLTGEEQSGRTDAELDACAREALAANPRRWFVNEYLTWREYGGPEEGGWHFDAGPFIECRGAASTGQLRSSGCPRSGTT